MLLWTLQRSYHDSFAMSKGSWSGQ